MDTFCSTLTSPRILNTRLANPIWLANPKWSHSHFPHDVWSPYKYLIHYQSEEDALCFPNHDDCWTYLTNFEQAVQSLSNTCCLFGVRSLDPHQTSQHSNIGVRLKKAPRLSLLALHIFTQLKDLKQGQEAIYNKESMCDKDSQRVAKRRNATYRALPISSSYVEDEGKKMVTDFGWQLLCQAEIQQHQLQLL